MPSAGVTLENARTTALVVPDEGGRVQSLVDRRSGRELLLQRPDRAGRTRDDFHEASTGGWDEMFPSTEPWNGYPDHGAIWVTPFDVEEEGPTTLFMSCELGSPPVVIERRVSLLDDERCGVKVEMSLSARAATEPFLCASHPLLATGEGWRVEIPASAANAVVEAEYPGRLAPGPVDPGSLDIVVPSRETELCEFVYVEGVDHAEARSPDGRRGTRVRWDATFLRYLWVIVITGLWGFDDCLLLEPSTSRPYRLADATRNGTTVTLGPGEQVTWSVTVESLDQ